MRSAKGKGKELSMSDLPQDTSRILSSGRQALVVIFWMAVAALVVALTVAACDPVTASHVVNSL
jgi:hypothetical protein